MPLRLSGLGKVRAFEAGKVCFPKVSLTGRRSLGEIGEDGERGYEVKKTRKGES